jgi:hypothetical protein
MVDTVGFWKKPVQLTARAKVASAAKAPTGRSLGFVDDIVLSDSLGALARLRKRPLARYFLSCRQTFFAP